MGRRWLWRVYIRTSVCNCCDCYEVTECQVLQHLLMRNSLRPRHLAIALAQLGETC
jgi:hypothetical protein